MSGKLIIVSITLAGTFIAGTHALAGTHQLEVFALFLALTASVYGGAALTPGALRHARVELPFLVIVFAMAIAGLAVSPLWIAIGFFAHGAWDLLHHAERIRTPIARAFPPLCAVFDLLVGGAVLAVWLAS